MRRRFDADAAMSRTAAGKPLLRPLTQRALRLLTQRALRLPTQPTPCEFDGQRPEVAIPGLADSLFAHEVPARPQRAAEASGRSDLASIREVTPRDERGRVHPRAHFADRAQRHEPPQDR